MESDEPSTAASPRPPLLAPPLLAPPLLTMFRGATGAVLILLCLMYFIEYIDRVNLSVAGPLIKREMGLSNIGLGLAFSSFGYCYAATQLLGGYLGDRIGARLALTILGLVWAFGTVATGLAGGLLMLIGARFLVGLGEAGTLPCAARVITGWVAAERRGAAQGFAHAAARLGASVTPLLMVMLMAWQGWRAAFYLLGALSLVWVAAWALYFRDDPKSHRFVTARELARLPPYQPAVRAAAAVPWRPVVRRMLPTTIVFFCHAWTLWLYLTWLPSFFHAAYHLDIKQSAIFTPLAEAPDAPDRRSSHARTHAGAHAHEMGQNVGTNTVPRPPESLKPPRRSPRADGRGDLARRRSRRRDARARRAARARRFRDHRSRNTAPCPARFPAQTRRNCPNRRSAVRECFPRILSLAEPRRRPDGRRHRRARDRRALRMSSWRPLSPEPARGATIEAPRGRRCDVRHTGSRSTLTVRS